MARNNRVVFKREYGTEQLTTSNDELVTTVSQPDWGRFIHAVGSLAGQSVGAYITTPELITSTDVTLPELLRRQRLIESRIAEAKDATRQFPNATLLLGTVAFDPTVEKPRNAVVFLRDGVEVGVTYKIEPLSHQEREFFYYPPEYPPDPSNVVKPAGNVLVAICSDLIGPPPIDTATNTLLVSGCWGVPTSYPGESNLPAVSDSRLATMLEGITEGLFEQHPNLATVIMTDRVPEGSTVAGPFNFVATR